MPFIHMGARRQGKSYAALIMEAEHRFGKRRARQLHADAVELSLTTRDSYQICMRRLIERERTTAAAPRSRCILNPDDFRYGDGRPLSAADKRRFLTGAFTERRALTNEDRAVHRAIAAMQRPTRANEP
jgi:hypothetical protein